MTSKIVTSGWLEWFNTARLHTELGDRRLAQTEADHQLATNDPAA